MKKTRATDSRARKSIITALRETVPRWDEMKTSQQERLIHLLSRHMEMPNYERELATKSLSRFLDRHWDMQILLMGVFLGISGGLIANLLDRTFVHYGANYDKVVIAIFLGAVGGIYFVLRKATYSEVSHDSIIDETLELLAEHRNAASHINS